MTASSQLVASFELAQHRLRRARAERDHMRERAVIALSEEGLSVRQIAERLEISKSHVHRLLAAHRPSDADAS